MVSRLSNGFGVKLRGRKRLSIYVEGDMAVRIEDDEPAVLKREHSQEPALATVVRPPALLVAQEAEWLAHLDQLPPYRRTFRERIVEGLRRVWDGPPEEPLTEEELRMIMQPPEEEEDLPELVSPADPERLAWEAHLRSIGVRPATKWNFPIREPIRRPSFWEKFRYRVSRGW
jgi:hypothetical protein